jgi:signal transduction histidine kinase
VSPHRLWRGRRRHEDETERGWRWWPRGIAGRVAMILIICLLAAQAIGMMFYVRDRAQTAMTLFALSIADQVVAIVELMEATPAAERPDLLRALNNPLLRVALAESRPDAGGEESWHADEIRPTVMRYLRGLGERPVEVRILEGWHHFWDPDADQGKLPDLLPSRQKVAVSVGLADGSWLVFTVASDITSLRWGLRTGFWVMVLVLVILVFAVWAAHRVTRPVRRFAEAADRLGVDVDAPPLPETGAREIRKASRAFNRMQERLRRFVGDRTLMLAAISHDLRTALTRLKLRTEFIADEEQRQKAVADLDEMQAMLDSTLSFARDDAQGEARTKVDLASLLQSLCDDLADAGQQVIYEGPGRLACECRPVALRRAFANLIDNAVRYGGEAAVTLIDTEGGVEVTVADRGPGIPEDRREDVFAPFFRLEGSRSRETGGTGLGLAVARTIIHGHGGDIALEDRPGGGLIVRVSLPA